MLKDSLTYATAQYDGTLPHMASLRAAVLQRGNPGPRNDGKKAVSFSRKRQKNTITL